MMAPAGRLVGCCRNFHVTVALSFLVSSSQPLSSAATVLVRGQLQPLGSRTRRGIRLKSRPSAVSAVPSWSSVASSSYSSMRGTTTLTSAPNQNAVWRRKIQPHRPRLSPSARDPSIPDVIIEAEKNSNKQRPFRFAGYGLFGAYGAAVVLSNAGVMSEELSSSFPLLTFFDSQPVSLAIGGLAAALSVYFVSTEIEQREQNIVRIWEEVQKRAQQGTLGQKQQQQQQQTADDKQTRTKKKKGKKSSSRNRGFSRSTAEKQAEVVGVDSTPTAASMQQRQQQEEKKEEEEEGGRKAGIVDGLLGSVKDTMQQANAMARVQALEINSALEDSGVLPRLNQTGTGQKGE
eukprot:jgi/Bigna1/89575/estExt_fgenesh1_pg.C_510153